jgi:dTDP-4-dehydrorhamnose reductase
MRVAVTGAGGRLGSSMTALLRTRPSVGTVLAWDLPEHNLDDPSSAERLVAGNRPDMVIHAAAWTDVDGCARDPELAMRRNGLATGEMARACASIGAAMITISTNEVFDGLRTDGRPYDTSDATNPGNAYGAAKLAGELAARAAFGASGADFAAASTDGGVAGSGSQPPLAIVRTAWLFGLPGADYPQKILAAAAGAKESGLPLRLVSDEIGCPTYAPDLAAAIVDLIEAWRGPGSRRLGGIHHIVNGGHASRADWAREVLRVAGIDVPTEDVPSSTWPRPSTPPAWGVLSPTPLPGGALRPWQEAFLEYWNLLRRARETGL